MPLPRSAARALGVVTAAALTTVAVAACREPTAITLVLSTDIPCSQLGRTSIYVGPKAELASPLGELALSAEATTCDPATKTIGTIAVIPSGERTDTVSVRVVGRLASSDCDRDLKSGCVEARRTIGFLPHTSLRLPISLDAACKDFVCASADETCVRGRCVPALVDPNACVGGTCPDPGGDGGTPSDAASDAPTTCAPLLPAITYVWHFDDPTDNLTQEENQAFPATTLGNGDGLGNGAPACGKALVRTSATGGTKLAIGKLLTNEFFQAAFRFKTTGPQLLVLYKATPLVGWRFGVEQGKAFMESCDGQQCQTTSAGASVVTDDQWHRVEIVSSQSGISFAVDGVSGVQLATTPKTISDATLIVTGVGSLDELTFHAN